MVIVGKRPLASFVLALALLSAVVPLYIAQAESKSDPLVEIPGTVSGSLNTSQAAIAPSNAQNDMNEIVVVLKPRNEAVFEDLARAVNNPKSARYRQFVSDAEFQQNFAPTAQTIEQFKEFFQAEGLAISYQNQDGLILSVKGSRAQLDKTFNTTSEFRVNDKKQTGFINTSPVRLPASLAQHIKGLAGFNTLHHFQTNSSYIQHNYFGMPQAPITTSNTPTSTRQAYNIDATGLDGTGVTVAMTLWGAPDANDTARWLNYWGRPLNLTIIPPTPGSTDDNIRFEANMDVQLMHTYAPKAAQRFYIGEFNLENYMLIPMARAIDDNVNVLSNSWGGCERDTSPAMISAYRTLFARATSKGIPVFFGSGDSGIYNCTSVTSPDFNLNLKSGYASFPADEFITSVGGTMLSRDDTTGAWFHEIAWTCQVNQLIGDFYCLQSGGGSGGGGMANFEPRPAFQSNITPPVETKFTNQPTQPTRLQPDLSMNAETDTGQIVFVIIQGIPIFGATCNDSCLSGGTSASTPAMAGIAALATQKNGAHVGTFNYFIYQHANGAPWLYDVTEGYNGVTAKPGWDFTTGLGSLKDANAFVNDFTASATVRPFVYANQVQPNEVVGNNNGVIELNETIGLQIELQNNGLVTAEGVSAQLASLSPGVTMLNATTNYPAIAHTMTATNATKFSFKLTSPEQCGATLKFRLTVNYNGSFSYNYDFSLPTGTPAYGSPVTYVYQGGPAVIPDNSPSGITLTLPLSATGRVGDINIKLSATHTRVSDVQLNLVSPNGTRRVLSHKAGGTSGQNYSNTIFDDEATSYINQGVAPFSGRYKPEEPLSAVDSEFISGTWKLVVADLAAGTVGSLDSWELEITPANYNCGAVEPPRIVPTLIQLSPATLMAGNPDFTLTVTGTNFMPGAVLRWNASDKTTNLLSETLATTTIPASDIATSGLFTVTLTNPGPQGGESNVLTVTVQPCAEFIITRSQTDGYCGSLNRAIQQANTASQAVNISFGQEITRVVLTAPLSQIGAAPGVAITLDGGCNAGKPVMELVASTGAGNVGLNIGSNVTLRGLLISGASSYAVQLAGNNNRLLCNQLGKPNAPNGGGVQVLGNNNQLGLSDGTAGNTIYGKLAIRLTSGKQLKIYPKNIILS